MPLYTLNRNEYDKLLNSLDLHLLKTNTFGLDEHYPLQNLKNVNKLYNDYTERDGFLEDFLNNKVSKENVEYIIWCESGRINNNQYIYKKEGVNFIFENEESNYFKEVVEAEIFCNCIIIDFFGLFGLNHSNDSRNDLNNKAKKNYDKYNEYLKKYVNSILEIIGKNDEEFKKLEHIIAAPKQTSISILNYLRSILGIVRDIKIYELNSRGLVADKFYIDKYIN